MPTESGKPRQAERDGQRSALSIQPAMALRSWLMPSVADLIFVLLLFSLSLGTLAPRLLGDADAGWHIRNGQHILAVHSIPHHDYFSYTKAGQPWFSWEWMFDVIAGTLDSHWGLNGVVAFSAFLIALTFAVAFRVALKRSRHLLVAALFIVLSLLASSIHFLARPHVVSWLLAIMFWTLLEEYKSAGAAHGWPFLRLIWLPILMLLWVNLHGGFILGLILIACYLLGECWEYFSAKADADRTESKKVIGQLGTIGALSLIVTLVNPYGYRLWGHIISYLTNRFFMDNIEEFRSPNFHGAAEKCFALLLLLSMLILAFHRSRIRPAKILVILFAIYAGLYAARNLPVASLLLTLSVTSVLATNSVNVSEENRLAPQARRFLDRIQAFDTRVAATELSSRGHILPVIATLFCLLVVSHQGRVGDRQIMNSHFSAKKFPVAAANFLAAQHTDSHVFAPDSWGGYLIYRFYPNFHVFVDDRHDFYGEAFLRDYVAIRDIQPQFQSLLDRYQVNCVLMPIDSALISALQEIPSWKLAYEDKTAVIYERVAKVR